jgi:hypothetical protein
MANDFLNELETAMNGDGNVAYTENGAVAFASTKSTVLDFFANGGALRSRDESSIINVFEKAYAENPLLATKAMFYFRDIRGGQGERRTFRILLNHLAKNHPEVARANLALIAEYGRWDDLYSLIDTDLEEDMFTVIDVQLADDMNSENPSLLAKWLASENSSSATTKRYGRKTRQALNMSPRQYRKTLSAIRRRIGLVEQAISQNEWSAIQYDKLPSKAGLQYRKAFYRHDAERYAHFLEEVKAGTKTINAGTLYPYEIVEKCGYGYHRGSNADSATLDAMWNALPDYFGENEVRGLVVADVSGSMSGRPMDVSISLAIYTAEHNKGPFAGKFITFSARPTLQKVTGNTITEKVQNLSRAAWDMNTDIEAVFDLILDTAVRGKMSQDELPTHLYIVSDMEFDAATSSSGGYRSHRVSRADERLFQTIERRYADAGYQMPFLVFWNVNSRNDQQPMSMDQRGFQLVSGCSPSIFTSLLSNKATSAYDLMLEVLNQERYDAIRAE